MSLRAHARWLETQFPDWVARGWIGAEAVEQIRRHYAADRGSGRSWLRVLLAILGAVLMGGGVILLLAHNWAEFSRAHRAAIALGALLLGQIVAALAIRRPPTSTGAREAAATFAALTVGAALALIEQTYHVYEGTTFTLKWMLLTLPLVYTHEAVMPALFYVAGISVWGVLECEGAGPSAYLPLLAPIGPHLAARLRRGQRVSAALLLWAMAIGMAVCLSEFSAATGMPRTSVHLPIMLAYLFALYGLLDALFFERDWPLAWRPFKILGVGGLATLLFVFSFQEPAGDLPGLAYFSEAPSSRIGLLLAGVLPALWLAALVAAGIRRGAAPLAFGIAPLFLTLAPHAFGPWTWLGVNAYLLALGLWTMATGARERDLGRVNGGLWLVGGLIVIRFFDSELSFLAKGLAFIAVGAAFLAANLGLAPHRRRRPR
jgi:hypothetical protein